MLTRIHCDRFSDQIPDKTICFHDGLNCVVGTDEATNSIGKTLLLLIIDYCLGGTKYTEKKDESDSVKHLGNHEIDFSFVFDDVQYDFKRKTDEPNSYYECDKYFKIVKGPQKINLLRKFLKEKYSLSDCKYSFRELVDRFLRIYGKENYNPSKPLYIKGTKDEEAVNALEMLFSKYNLLDSIKTQKHAVSDQIKAYLTAERQSVIAKGISNKKELKEKQNEIATLNKEIEIMVDSFSRGSEITSVSLSDKNIELLSQHDDMVKEKDRIRLRLKKLKDMTGESRLMTDSDLNGLKLLFPRESFNQLTLINDFQKRIIQNVNSEIESSRTELEVRLKEVEKQLTTIEAEMSDEKLSNKMTKNGALAIAEKITERDRINAEISRYDKTQSLKEKKKLLEIELKNKEKNVLSEIAASVNEELEKENSTIYKKSRQAPMLVLKDASHYSFSTPNDKGNGTDYKNIILFDLTLLKLSMLPFVIHDTPLFKEVWDEPVDNIFRLYSSYRKQIFVAIDRINTLDDIAKNIIERNQVIRLGLDKDSLFGFQWNLESDVGKGE